ncbi:MAG: phosphopantetheine-binding protein [Paludibacteraceae bacterium]|jgi:acyl carrier protein|nr:acyl carrier protein [Prevotellaceae bacterium]
MSKEEELIEELKTQIIDALSLEDITPADIDADAPLFVEGLGLDSIDAIELMLLLERNYGIRIEDPKKRREVLTSVRTMAKLIESKGQVKE